jgi:hypothetical protein
VIHQIERLQDEFREPGPGHPEFPERREGPPRPEHREGPPPPEHLERAVHELHGQVEEMRRQMEEMRGFLRKIAERVED